MDKPSVVYVTYISTTPEKLWQALTEPSFTQQYWATSFTTDWKPGSEMVWDNHGVTVTDPEQVVLEADPFRRLSYTWCAFTPELASHFGMDEAFQAQIASEPRSKVTFEIEPKDDTVVKLTVVHDGFEPGSIVEQMVNIGWPDIISSLKTLLETGVALPA